MRKLFLVAALAATAAATMPAQARTISSKSLTFKAAVPCTNLCAYNLDWQWATDEARGFTYETDDVLADARAASPQACSNPFPEGSYDDYVVTAPRYSDTLIFKAYPKVDWDIVVCSKPKSGNNGKELGFGANSLWDFDTMAPGCAVACVESITIPVKPGRKYVLRAYNYSDPDPLKAKIWFKDIR